MAQKTKRTTKMVTTKRPTSRHKAKPVQKFRSKPKFRIKIALVAVVFFISIGLYFLYASRAATPVNTGSDLCGTWVLQQVSSSAELNNLKSKINAALDVPGVVGFSVRFPWDAADLSGSQTSNSLLDASRKLVDDYNATHVGANKQLSIRFMAGRHTPKRVFDGGASYYLKDSGKVPVPWDNSTGTRAAFLNEYDKYMDKLVSWANTNNVKLVHMSWYGQDWAELNHGKEVRAAEGYTSTKWLEGHKALIDVGVKHSSNTTTVELPMSGYGDLASSMSPSLTDYIISKVGANSSRFFIQANGWGPNGEWGAPSADVEAAFDRIWAKPIMRGLQMIQPQDYNWSQVYPRLTQNKASYAEVYLPSFTLASQAQLKSEITDFAKSCQTPTQPPPEDSIKPVVTISAPTPGATLRGTTTITANATDNTGVTKVNLLIDDQNISSDTTEPYSVSWNTGTVANGSHSVSAIAYDAVGNSASSSVNVTVSNTATPPPPPPPPPSTLSAPTNFSILARNFVTTTGFSLQWDPVNGATNYNLYRNGSLVSNALMQKNSTGKITAYDSSIKGLTGYTYDVSAISSSGQESARSNSAYGRCDWFLWWFCK